MSFIFYYLTNSHSVQIYPTLSLSMLTSIYPSNLLKSINIYQINILY